MKIYHPLKNEDGVSIVAVIIMVGILTIAGVVFVSMFSTGVEQSVVEVISGRALYLAEAGSETAIGKLKKNPVTTNWLWNDGYSAKPLTGGTFDVEVLEYENRDSAIPGAGYVCTAIEIVVKPLVGGANTARTVLATLSSASASNLGMALYNANVVASCAAPPGGNLVDTITASNVPKTMRYRIPEPGVTPVTYTYTMRVTGINGTAYNLRISHPDEPTFSASGNACGTITGAPYKCQRGLLSLGRANNARRETFQGLSR